MLFTVSSLNSDKLQWAFLHQYLIKFVFDGNNKKKTFLTSKLQYDILRHIMIGSYEHPILYDMPQWPYEVVLYILHFLEWLNKLLAALFRRNVTFIESIAFQNLSKYPPGRSVTSRIAAWQSRVDPPTRCSGHFELAGSGTHICDQDVNMNLSQR